MAAKAPGGQDLTDSVASHGLMDVLNNVLGGLATPAQPTGTQFTNGISP